MDFMKFFLEQDSLGFDLQLFLFIGYIHRGCRQKLEAMGKESP